MALFSSTQPSLRARVLPRFPADVRAGSGITIVKAGNTYTFSTSSGNVAPVTITATGPVAQGLKFSGTGRFTNVIEVDPNVAVTNGYLFRAFQPSYNADVFSVKTGTLNKAGTATPGSANEWQLEMFAAIPVTSSPASYEKAALYSHMNSDDPSTALIRRDCLAGEFIGTATNGNLTARVWGIHVAGQCDATSDGLITGMELSVVNNGTDQPIVGVTTTKTILGLVADGINPVSTGIWFNSIGPAFYHNFMTGDPNFVVPGGYLINFPGAFTVDQSGRMDATSVVSLTGGSSFIGRKLRLDTQAVTLVNGLNSNISWNSSRLRITGPSAGFSVGGFVAATGGWRLSVYNAVAQQMTIVNEDASSSATSRIKTLTGANVVLRAGTSFATFSYDDIDQRWILESTN